MELDRQTERKKWDKPSTSVGKTEDFEADYKEDSKDFLFSTSLAKREPGSEYFEENSKVKTKSVSPSSRVILILFDFRRRRTPPSRVGQRRGRRLLRDGGQSQRPDQVSLKPRGAGGQYSTFSPTPLP